MARIGRLAEAIDLRLCRNTPMPVPALETSIDALVAGRGHLQAEPTPIYTSEDWPTANAEFLHHHPYFSGSTIRQTELSGRLTIIDATRVSVARALGVRVEDLIHESNWSSCQRLSRELFAQGVQALRLPSARSAGGTNVIVERSAGSTCLIESDISFRAIEKQ